MPPSRLTAAFQTRRGTGLIPYLTVGYPSLEATFEMLQALDAAGVMAVELGVPFSDPIADGPDIQRSSEWALREGVGIEDVLALVERFRATSTLPIVLMSYANPIVRMGVEAFATRARAVGVDGLIVSDLPPDEDPGTWAAFDAAGIDTVTLVAPTTEPARVPLLLERCRGFVYCLARTGVTGQGGGESAPLPERIDALRAATDLPIAVGFGISSGDDARRLRGVADACIVGAAFMRKVAEDPIHGAPERVGAFARELVDALA